MAIAASIRLNADREPHPPEALEPCLAHIERHGDQHTLPVGGEGAERRTSSLCGLECDFYAALFEVVDLVFEQTTAWPYEDAYADGRIALDDRTRPDGFAGGVVIDLWAHRLVLSQHVAQDWITRVNQLRLPAPDNRRRLRWNPRGGHGAGA